MSAPLEAVLVGAGSRGHFAYGPYALNHPDQLRFTAVVEPHEERRARFAKTHGISPEHCFRTWEELYAQGRLADVLLNCSLDRMHFDSTLPALEQGYDVLLEKPMTPALRTNVQLVKRAEQQGRLLMICHVLRYTGFFARIHEILASGRLGEVITVEHRENVSFWHMAHSFVRGNWRNSALECPMILAKCCHDLDLLFWNMGPVRRLQSFGALKHYRPENAPPGAPDRCTAGCPHAETCEWNAPRFYIRDDGNTGWPVSVLAEDPTPENLRQALETGPYGRCVFRCDNDVVDHQTVNLEFESGATGVLFMHGHSHEESRTMRYDGTRATLRARFTYKEEECMIEVHDHRTGSVERVPFDTGESGHGGGDAGIMKAFVEGVRNPQTALTTARESLESHLMAFAAEQSRLAHQVIDMAAFRQQAEAQVPTAS
jgi:predicted dehydrogenase